jgi:methylated-DNA-[protein]-cysteine S-methyltransferase
MTKFQKKVYELVKKIPRGRVLTYKQVAVKLGCAKLARAVGNALNKNKDSEVPCHRVIRSDGKIGGYNKGSLAKIRNLKREGIKIKNNKIFTERRGHGRRAAKGFISLERPNQQFNRSSFINSS